MWEELRKILNNSSHVGDFSSYEEKIYYLINLVTIMISEIIKNAARDLRKNSTKSEVLLWERLKWKQLNYRFNRQAPVYLFTENSWLHRYIIADFYCKEKNLIIELDWEYHNVKETYFLDKKKEELLKQKNIKVIRFTNDELYNDISSVVDRINVYINKAIR